MKKNLVVYSGGHILNQAMVEYRNKQHDIIDSIEGIECYSPHKDESINDKANAVQEGLAERILKNDFKAMQEADIYIFDILNEGIGTIAELGIVVGMKHEAQMAINSLKEAQDDAYDFNGDRTEEYYNLEYEIEYLQKVIDKPVLIYCSDIRQGHGKPYNDPDRAEFSTNQFVYGCVLHLTDGVGFISWEEVVAILKKLGADKGRLL